MLPTTGQSVEHRDPYGGTKSVSVLLSLSLMSALIFIPPAGFYLAGAVSHSAGLAVAFVIIIACLITRVRPDIPWSLLALVGAVIIVHGFVAAQLRPIDAQRAMSSLALLAMLGICACFIARWLFELEDKTIGLTLSILRYVMVVIAVFSLANIQPLSVNFITQPVFPFTEPSHFTLILAPLIAQACLSGNKFQRYIWLLVGLVLALLLKSLSLLVATALIAALCLPIWQLAIVGVISVSTLGLFDTSYFEARLDFSAHTTNQSALVYLQGWELATDAFRRTLGWGIGFQQLGQGVFDSPSADALFRLYSIEANLFDGGFLATKLASEFGVFGVALIGVYIVAAVRVSLLLRSVANGRLRLTTAETYAYAIFISYSMEFFVRSLGYFSASSTLFVAALLYLTKRRREAMPAEPSYQEPDFRRNQNEPGSRPG